MELEMRFEITVMSQMIREQLFRLGHVILKVSHTVKLYLLLHEHLFALSNFFWQISNAFILVVKSVFEFFKLLNWCF